MSVFRRDEFAKQSLYWRRFHLLGLFLFCCCAFFLLEKDIRAQSPPLKSGAGGMDPRLHASLQKTGSLELRDTSLAKALLTVSKIWNVDIVFGKDIQGQVNSIFQDKPLHEILDAILHVNGFSYYPLGSNLVVQKLGASSRINPLFQPTTITLRAIDPKDLLTSVEHLASPQGRIEAISSAHSLLVWDFPDRVHRIREFVEQLDRATVSVNGASLGADQQLEVAYFSPQYIDAVSLKEVVQTALSKDGKMAALEEENQLVVYDNPYVIRMVRQLIGQIDKRPAQVRITALIYDISLEDIEQLGINWFSAVKGNNLDADGNPQDVFSIDSLLQVPAAAGDPSGVITFMSLNRNFDISATVQALKKAKDSRLLANPTVAVVDRQNAMIRIVSEIPFQQLTETGQGGSIGTTAFREAGVTLSVLPKIARDGTIEMDVKPSFSRLTGFTTDEQPQPIIDRREAETVVRVADRQTLVIGGLRQRTDIGDFRGIPFLKDIKTFHLGKLFRSRDTTVRESELVVFITPEIIVGDEFGNEREINAHETGQNMLNNIPYASEIITPDCNLYSTEPIASPYPEAQEANVIQPRSIQHTRALKEPLNVKYPKPPVPSTPASNQSLQKSNLPSRKSNHSINHRPVLQARALPGKATRGSRNSSLSLLPTPRSIFDRPPQQRPVICRIPAVSIR